MLEITEQRLCENCHKETNHIVREGALDIEYICQDCHNKEEVIKTFF